MWVQKYEKTLVMKHLSKQEHVWLYYDTSNKLKEIAINYIIYKWVKN